MARTGRAARFTARTAVLTTVVVEFGALLAGRIPTPREMEAALRDMGFSRRQSRAFMAKGYVGLDPEAAAAEALAERIHALTDNIRSAIPTP